MPYLEAGWGRGWDDGRSLNLLNRLFAGGGGRGGNNFLFRLHTLFPRTSLPFPPLLFTLLVGWFRWVWLEEFRKTLDACRTDLRILKTTPTKRVLHVGPYYSLVLHVHVHVIGIGIEIKQVNVHVHVHEAIPMLSPIQSHSSLCTCTCELWIFSLTIYLYMYNG